MPRSGTIPISTTMRASICSAIAAAGLTAVIAIHSTALGPAAGGTRFWHYADGDAAITDALRLSRGMSYKNAMAGLPMGGGKGVILADAGARPRRRPARGFGRAIECLGGALCDGRGCRHVRCRHGRDPWPDAPCRRACRWAAARPAAIRGR